MKTIIGIDDDQEIHLLLESFLKKEYEYFGFLNLHHFTQNMQNLNPDLILLDINLGESSGFEFIKMLQKCPRLSHIPVIFLSITSGGVQQKEAFELGAVDFISKPIDELELKARIKTRLKDEKREASYLIKKDFHLNLSTQTLEIQTTREIKTIELTSLEFKLLYYFLKNADHILTREQILEEVWSDELGVSERVIDVHLSTLKKKSKDLQKRIKSIYGAGYKLETD